jgi:hypothetical protein
MNFPENIDYKVFVMSLDNILNLILNEEYESEEESITSLSYVLDFMIQIFNVIRYEDNENIKFNEKETEFIEYDETKTSKLLKKRFPFLKICDIDIEIKKKDFLPISEEFDMAAELASICRMIAQVQNICKKNSFEEAKAFFVFSMLMDSLTTSRYIQLYLQLLFDDNNPLLDLVDFESLEEDINKLEMPQKETKLKRIK